MIPLELCHIVPGQVAHKQLLPAQASQMIEFAKRTPADRFALIKKGVQVSAKLL